MNQHILLETGEIVEEKILEILEEVNEDIISYDGNDMYGEEVITSVEVLDIVSALEDEFDIEIDAKYVVAENFANKEAIIELVKMILG